MSSENASPSRKRSLLVIGLCTFAFLYVFPYTPVLNNPNENVRVYMTAAIVEDGTYAIDTIRARWGWVNDAAVYEGHYYSVKAPGTSVLGVPGYWLYYKLSGGEPNIETATWVMRFSGTILPVLIFLFFFYRWLGRRTRSALMRDAAFVSVALGSCFLGYGLLFVSHTTSAICGFGAFMLLYEARHRKTLSVGQALGAGLLVAGATFFEYPVIVVSVILSIYALFCLRPWRRLVPFAIGGAIPTLAMMHFQASAFGSPFSPGHAYSETAAFREILNRGFFGATHFHGDAALRLLFDWRIGLLATTPLLIAGLFGFIRMWVRPRERVDSLFAFLACAGLYVAICFMDNWDGGWAIGPRYLVPMIPFMAWGALRALERPALRFPLGMGILVGGLVLAGLATSGIPSIYYPHLPVQIDRPLAQVYSILMLHGFSPPTASNLFGLYGQASMIPMLGVAVLAMGGVVLGSLKRWRRAIGFLGAALFATALLVPQVVRTERDTAKRGFVCELISNWNPSGYDRATRLFHELAQEPTEETGPYLRLASMYFLLGCDAQSDAALHQAMENSTISRSAQ